VVPSSAGSLNRGPQTVGTTRTGVIIACQVTPSVESPRP
jgi:hypothetical protein